MMFDLTTIQLMNNHRQDWHDDPNYRTRDLIRPKNIRESSLAVFHGQFFLGMRYVDILDKETCFTPKPIIEGDNANG